MTSWYNQVKYSYLKLKKTELKENFLHDCLERKVLPKGLRLHFNLALVPTDHSLLFQLQAILDTASTSILKFIYQDTISSANSLQDEFENLKEKWTRVKGEHVMNKAIEWIKFDTKHTLSQISHIHASKLQKLESSVQSVQTNSSRVLRHQTGSLRLSASTVIEIPDNRAHDVHSYKKQNSKTNIRPHRRRTRKKRKNRTKESKKKTQKDIFTPTEEEKKRFDPIVLADNVKLSQHQISVCRLSDRFAPTPREPIDVADQVIGTHDWAERLRWHRFYATKKEEKKASENQDDSKEEDEDFVKMPWYQRTTHSAPKGDPALEAFIEACKRDFVNPKNRKRIKDNMTKEQRQALHELRNLPTTHNAACRFADKSGVTVITSLQEDDQNIVQTLNDPQQYDMLDSDPTNKISKCVQEWTKKWCNNGTINAEVSKYITGTQNAHPAKCKPLVKTHKQPPYPYRLLLSGSGTPIQPLSKFVQLAIAHLTSFLPYQIIDTKEFLQKIDQINKSLAPLPNNACLAVCDVVALYPSVDNAMGVPAVDKMLKKHPSPINESSACIVDALRMTLQHNPCYYTTGQQETIYASPNQGTAMGPCSACDYVDVFMGELDEKLVDTSPVPLLSSIAKKDEQLCLKYLDWSRFRDDGFAVLLNEEHIPAFEIHLQSLCPPAIKWVLSTGMEVEYLDVKLTLKDGLIHTDVFSKNCNSYIPPSSCHSPAVFKGLATGIGTRLRVLCSDNTTLNKRVREYAAYLTLSGWKWTRALREITKGANKDRDKLLNQPRKPTKKKIAWVSTYDPRVPSKSKIIKKNLVILYSNPENKSIFPKKTLIGADRRRRNLGEIYKPTVPRRRPGHTAHEEPGFFTCTRKCDTCRHSQTTKTFKSPWDSRTWHIKSHLTCTTPNTVYVIKCNIHPNMWYVGSTTNLKARWAGHKSDSNLGHISKCMVAKHINTVPHPPDRHLNFLTIFPIEPVSYTHLTLPTIYSV
eukprot:TRINITY_DN41575_c0_g2_i2.p1 TRINITY_DN41575_c0_g2~~TRINITY_DN41575_c0_g2_i2.p1  ORF type:complete len:978 (-),score=173.11 TRINITY_DN41575_c0_g2_i2:3-2936(-)